MSLILLSCYCFVGENAVSFMPSMNASSDFMGEIRCEDLMLDGG